MIILTRDHWAHAQRNQKPDKGVQDTACTISPRGPRRTDSKPTTMEVAVVQRFRKSSSTRPERQLLNRPYHRTKIPRASRFLLFITAITTCRTQTNRRMEKRWGRPIPRRGQTEALTQNGKDSSPNIGPTLNPTRVCWGSDGFPHRCEERSGNGGGYIMGIPKGGCCGRWMERW